MTKAKQPNGTDLRRFLTEVLSRMGRMVGMLIKMLFDVKVAP